MSKRRFYSPGNKAGTGMQLAEISSCLIFWIMINWESKLRNPFYLAQFSFPMTEQRLKEKNKTGIKVFMCLLNAYTQQE